MIHLAQNDGPVGNFLEGNDLQVFDHGRSVGAAVGFDQAYDNIDALRAHEVGGLEHLKCLADAGRGAKVDAQLGRLRSDRLAGFGEGELMGLGCGGRWGGVDLGAGVGH